MKTAEIFGDAMILQQGKPVAVWGSAAPGMQVNVRIQSKEAQTKAGEDGYWRVILPALDVSFQETMEITGEGPTGTDYIRYQDIAVGEVWLAGGQSNMEYQMFFDEEKEQEKEKNDALHIRVYCVPKVSYEGQGEPDGQPWSGFWRKCTRDDLDYFTAAGYYFARKMEDALQVPIGVIDCTWGGTRACCWMTEEAIMDAGGERWIRDYQEGLDRIDAVKEAQDYRADPANAPSDPFADEEGNRVMYPGISREEQEKIVSSDSQDMVIGTCHPWRPTGLFYTMLRKIIPYTVKGIIYYQGESDDLHAELYEKMLTGLIRLWRKEWGEELPFLMVQLAPFESWFDCSGKRFPEVRAAQQAVADREPGVWLASNGDAGMRYDIHPKRKRPAGERLALLALGHVYGGNVVCDAPVFDYAEWEGKTIVLHFANVRRFCLRGDKINALKVESDGKELDAAAYSAEIREDLIRITPEKGSRGQKVRISFAETPFYEINLFNEAGLPVLPFDTEYYQSHA